MGYQAVQVLLRGIRKIDPHMRYLVTEENGERNGRLHWHALLHVSEQVTKRSIEALWPHGYTVCRLAKDARLAQYMAKYQAKAGRLRASIHYGRTSCDPGERADLPVKAEAAVWARKRQLPDHPLILALGRVVLALEGRKTTPRVRGIDSVS